MLIYWRNMWGRKRLARVRVDRANAFHTTKSAQKAYSKAEEKPINTGEIIEVNLIMICNVWWGSALFYSHISSEDESHLNDIDLVDDAENELAQLNSGNDKPAQSMFNM